MTERDLAPAERYATLFRDALPALPGARDPRVREFREASFERFQRLGFPGPKAEAWKYTSVGPITRRLSKSYMDLVRGVDKRHSEWRTPVYKPMGAVAR